MGQMKQEDSRNEFIGFRASKETKVKLERYAKEKHLSTGDVMNLGVLSFIGEHKAVSKILREKYLEQ